jgi:hypothetical protein
MNYKLKILASLIVAMIILMPAIAVTPVKAIPELSKTVSGVLSTDTYLLYPYKAKDLVVGFSKYGELIDEITNVGLLYSPDKFDPFANDLVEKYLWQNGWILNITYTHRTAGVRNVWAAALFSDLVKWGGDWVRVTKDTNGDGYITPADAPNGGRKTTGECKTEDIKILYNGPRRFVALLNTTVYDVIETTKVPLARLLITLDFNKVKKSVTLMKDIKFIIDEKLIMGYVSATFSERGQWDMGKEVLPKHIKAYAHFYTEGGTAPDEALDTCYGPEWHVNGSIIPHKFALAQMISEYWPYVGFAAFWPHPDFWTVDGWNVWDRSIAPLGLKEDDMVAPPTPAEPDVPYIIGEWIFTSEYPHYRVVTVYGVTDENDAKDAERDGVNSIDSEVLYQLNEIFNPYDLQSAVKKTTSRFVKFVDGPIDKDSYIPLNEPLPSDEWNKYCSFTERVILLPDKKLWVRGTDYKLADSDNNGKYDGITLITPLASGKTLKILYSVESMGSYEWIVVGRESRAVDSAGAAMVTEALRVKDIEVKLAGLDMQDMVFGSSVPWVMAKFGTGTSRSDYYYLDGSMRAALRDDHCKKYPISSSNIISVGGPFANLATEYFAEFTPALGWSQFPVWSLNLAGSRVDTLMAISCWSKNEYRDTATIGYAIISVYKDINGTVGLLIYGWTGQDTYWASTWLWMEGIEELQSLNPCVTSIILKIDYSKCIPSVSIVELLGTISEKKPHTDP